MFLDAGVEGVEPLDGALGHDLQRPDRRELLVERGPLRPAVAHRQGQVGHAGEPLDAVGFFFQLRDFRVELVALGGQMAVAMVDRAEFLDFRPQLLVLGQQLHHLARPAGGVEDAVARGLQLLQHLDQRHAVQSGREVVEQFGGLGVAQRGQLLNFAQADGEDVVEHRLVDVRQQHLDEMLALPGAVGSGQRELLAGRAVGGRVVAADLEAAVRAGHVERSAGPAAVQRRQVSLPLRAKSRRASSG